LVERVESFADAVQWGRAYTEIISFEKQLVRSGMMVQKFWLSISKEEQYRRFEERRNTPWKRHKITEEDWRNRERWDEYQAAASEMIARTHSTDAPWHVVNSEDKRRARIEVLKILNQELDAQLKR
ncbi:polyphosphate:AMP phosphotransferase, partial [Myxococcota bacterium]|nr:polyphosphate:AMP phosphotransferase [Myxococcota bacterium]